MKAEAQNLEKSSLVVKREGISPTNSSNCLTKERSSKQKQTTQSGEDKIDPNQHIYETVWQIVFLVTLSIGVILGEKVYRFHNDPSTTQIPKGSIYDFWISIVVAISIALLRYTIKLKCQTKIYGLLNEKRTKTQEEGMKRADQLCKWLFDFIYYSLSTIIGYLVVKDQPFLPPTLFGEGTCSNLFMQYPYLPEIPYLKLFYLVQAGTHFYTLIHQLVAKRTDPKFYEFALHHMLAMFLVWFSYMMNFLIVGTIVLILHDPGDVLLIAARFYNDLKCRIFAINAFLICLSYPLWIYTRNIIFPQCVLKTCVEFYQGFNFEMYDRDIYSLPIIYMISMLGILAVMHIYWIYFYSKAILTFVQGKEKNGYDS